MVRIKGVNSDYQYSIEEKKILEDKTNTLYMRIFICPNDQPSAIEQREEKACCEGQSATCTGSEKSGHAAVELHQKNGIYLQTDGAVLQLDQAGKVILKSANEQTAEIFFSEKGLKFNACGTSLNIDSNGNLELAAADGKTLTLRGNVEIEGDIKGRLLEIIQKTVDSAIKRHEIENKHG